MITIINTTNRSVMNTQTSSLVIHNFPFFKETLMDVTPSMVKEVFKGMKATVIIVKDNIVATRAHTDNPDADIYVLAKGTHCVTLAFKGTNGIVQQVEETTVYNMCPSEMINFN